MIKAVFDRLIGRGLRFAKRAYQSLPLSYESKAAHRRVIARLFPGVLLRSGAPRASIPALAMVSEHLAIGLPYGPAVVQIRNRSRSMCIRPHIHSFRS